MEVIKSAKENTDVKLRAPLSGVLVLLKDIPDPVFAQGMIGQGLAIDPTEGKLFAPVDGTIINFHPSRHALTLQTGNGVQILIHVGIDTVKLRGQGFKPKVKTGDSVRAGDLLMEFDLDELALQAHSLVTPILVIEPKNATLRFTADGNVQAGLTELFAISTDGASFTADSQPATGDALKSKTIRVQDPTGLHARPAALIAATAQKFVSKIEVELENRRANAKSLIGIMSLEIPGHAKIRFIATGADAASAIQALEDEFGGAASVENQSASVPESSKHLAGATGSKGVVVGRVHHMQRVESRLESLPKGNPDEEEIKLADGLLVAKQGLLALEEEMRKEIGAEKAAIFAAHRGLLEDPDLLKTAFGKIRSGSAAAIAWQNTVTAYVAQLQALKSELFASRAGDLRDVGQRVLNSLTGNSKLSFNELKDETILVAEDLGPSDLAAIAGSKVVGICTTSGGTTSHVSIIARSLGLPALVGVDKAIFNVEEGSLAILDATQGELRLDPTTEEIQSTLKAKIEVSSRRAQDIKTSQLPATTKDGHQVQVAANLTTQAEAIEAISYGAEGVGLLRSELFFLEQPTEPAEEEQFQLYKAVASQFQNHPVIIRTLDIGGDKPLPYLPMRHESNPFLGERGIRFTLNNEDLFRRQLRAIVRAAEYGKVHVMFPMVACLSELKKAKAILQDEARNLSKAVPPVGIMIEVPSAVMIAERLAQEVEFFSIGTNDLTQYALAMDRTSSTLAKQVDGLHPSVLRLIQITTEAAHKYGKWVGVCGGLAGESEAIPILVGLGVDELSVSVPALPTVRAAIRQLSLTECKALAEKCLKAADASEVRELL